jgi:hypothetical protein
MSFILGNEHEFGIVISGLKRLHQFSHLIDTLLRFLLEQSSTHAIFNNYFGEYVSCHEVAK